MWYILLPVLHHRRTLQALFQYSLTNHIIPCYCNKAYSSPSLPTFPLILNNKSIFPPTIVPFLHCRRYQNKALLQNLINSKPYRSRTLLHSTLIAFYLPSGSSLLLSWSFSSSLYPPKAYPSYKNSRPSLTSTPFLTPLQTYLSKAPQMFP